MASLGRPLLAHNDEVCLFVNAADRQTAAIYRRLGFHFRRRYRLIRFEPARAAAPVVHLVQSRARAGVCAE